MSLVAMQTSPSLPTRGGSFGKNFFPSNSPGFVMKSATMDMREQKQQNRRSMTGAKTTTFSPHLASVIMSRRKSIDGADLLRSRTPSPVLDASMLIRDQQLAANATRLTRSRSLPCISSWDYYGEETITVTFDNKRASISSYTNLADHLRSLGAFDSPLYARSTRGRGGSAAERIKQDDVIYEVHKDKHYIVYATKEKLLKALVDPRTDIDFISQFLETHQWHTSAPEIFDRLVEIFNPGMQSHELFTTRMRVLCVLQLWSTSYPADLQPFQEKVDNFLQVLVPASGFTPLRPDETTQLLERIPSPKPTMPKKLADGAKHQFLDFHPTEVARQLTLMEHQRFRDIPRTEFVRQGWNKKDGATKSPAIVSCIKKFNEISYWVAAEIVFCANAKQRVTVVKRMIQIANKCLAFNNFNTVMEIIAGLHMSSIQRLKKTWKALSSKYVAIFEEITKFIATEGNYRNYRLALSKVELPANPYLGVFLRDLTFIEDGNPDFVEDDSLMNFEKMRMISNVLSTIAKYQKVPYNFEPVPVIQDYIINGTAVNLSDSALHKYSLLCEASSVSGGGTLGAMEKKTKRLSLR